MREPLRSRYLAALGVDNYVPRMILPGARLSTVCEWDVEALEAALLEPQPAAKSIARPLAALINDEAKAPPAVSLRERSTAPVQPAENEAQTAATSADKPSATSSVIPSFALGIALAANGVMLIDDAPASAAARGAYERLLGAFLKAVNKDSHFALDVFSWPLRKSPHIAQDENAARETLAAHLQKQIQQRGLTTVLLLGETAQQWAPLENAGVRCIRSASLLACLQDASLKRQIWTDVRDLAAP